LLAYLFAFVYWLSLALGALLMVSTFHASRARWPTVLRRPLEILGGSFPLLALLFVPLALGVGKLYPWISPPPPLRDPALPLLAHTRPSLNPTFFFARAALYFVSGTVIGELFLQWSKRRDEMGGVRWTVWERRLGAGGLFWLAISVSGAALDWVMSLEPL